MGSPRSPNVPPGPTTRGLCGCLGTTVPEVPAGGGWGRRGSRQTASGAHSLGAPCALCPFVPNVGLPSHRAGCRRSFHFLSAARLCHPAEHHSQSHGRGRGDPEVAQPSCSQPWLHFRSSWACVNTSSAQACPPSLCVSWVGAGGPCSDCRELVFCRNDITLGPNSQRQTWRDEDPRKAPGS